MKKILLSAVLGLSSTALFAQLPVSTAPENRNAVLEEFTGIYCQFCPDGHKLAQELKDQFPNDVILVNIHTGGFANPGAGDPDFRTTFGSALANQSDLAGYPAGTVNRRNFPGFEQNGSPAGATAMSRGAWAPISEDSVLTQSSYVNVALEGDIDLVTRELTVDVEAYFTANGASSVNLTVAVLQNNVEGPQTGAGTWYPSNILPNGNYNHQHMLRHFMTGQWGSVYTTTTMGSTISDQFTWTIPADINGVPVELGDLEIVAYIAEGQQNIISGAQGPITFTAPPGSVIVDLESNDNTSYPTSFCAEDITPSVSVTNMSNENASGYEVSYSIDGGTPVVQTISQALASGASATHDFPTVSLSAGNHMITYDVTLTTGGNAVEIVTGNNSASSNAFATVPATANMTLYSEDFESYADRAEVWDNTVMNGDGNFFVISQNSFQGIPNSLGGYGNSVQSFRHRLYAMNPTDVNRIITFKADMSSVINPYLTLDRAAAGFVAGFDSKFELLVSEDCGDTWTSVLSKQGVDLETGAPTGGQAAYYPAPAEWATDSIDLSAYSGSAELMFAFEITGGSGGNTFYLDNIAVNGTPASVSDINNVENYSIFPNPAQDVAVIQLELANSTDVEVVVYDMLGKVVAQVPTSTLTAGMQQITLNTNELSSGMYYVNIQANGKIATEKLIIKK